MSDVWLHALNSADSERDILETARDFLASWTPTEISRLPESCRPGRMGGGEDINEFAYRLAQQHLDFSGDREDRLLLERMMAFFVHAASRLAQVGADRNVEAPGGIDAASGSIDATSSAH